MGVGVVDAYDSVAPPTLKDSLTLAQELLLRLEFVVLIHFFSHLLDLLPFVKRRPQRYLLWLI